MPKLCFSLGYSGYSVGLIFSWMNFSPPTLVNLFMEWFLKFLIDRDWFEVMTITLQELSNFGVTIMLSVLKLENLKRSKT